MDDRVWKFDDLGVHNRTGNDLILGHPESATHPAVRGQESELIAHLQLKTAICALAIDPSTIRLPAFTVVVPVEVFAPVKINVPRPVLVHEPVPAITPLSVEAVPISPKTCLPQN